MSSDINLNQAISRSIDYILSQQTGEGYWVDELESNASITAELIFFMHFTNTVDREKEGKLVNYLLHTQRQDGSWPLYFDGPCDINSTVESYMALKLAGISPKRPEMLMAKKAIFSNYDGNKHFLFSDYIKDNFNRLQIGSVLFDELFIDIGTPEDLFNASNILKDYN